MLNCHVKCDEVLKIAGAPVCKNLSKASNSNRSDKVPNPMIRQEYFHLYLIDLQGNLTFVLNVLDRF